MVWWKKGDEPKSVSLWLDNISYFYEHRAYVEYPLNDAANCAIKNIRYKLLKNLIWYKCGLNNFCDIFKTEKFNVNNWLSLV